jgi:hypothetical protein
MGLLAPAVEEDRRLRAALDALGPSPHRPQVEEEAEAVVHAHPGIAVYAVATLTHASHNELYVVLHRLERQGRVVKQGQGWYPPGWLEAQDQATRALWRRPGPRLRGS